MNREEIEQQLKLSKKQNKEQRYDYLCSQFNCINYAIKLEKYTNKLQRENRELKKQLEKKYEKVGTLTGELLYEENTRLINQQKEFIEWLEQKVKKYTPNLRVNELDEFGYRVAQYINAEVYEIPPEDVVKEVLSKYKEIIGVEV